LGHRGQVHLDERHDLICAAQPKHGDGVRGEPVRVRGPAVGAVRLLPAGAVGQPASDLHTFGSPALGHGQPGLGDRGGMRDEHPGRAAVGGCGPGDDPGARRAQPPVPGRGATLPARPGAVNQVGGVQPLHPVPDGAFWGAGGAGELAAGHHPMLIEQHQQLMRRPTGGAQPGQEGSVSDDAAAEAS
jgi:hypothetical protein